MLPNALNLLSLRLEPFGLFLALGLALGVALAHRLALRAGLPLEPGLRALVAALLGALLGARCLYLATSGAPVSLRSALSLTHGGLSGYGALLGALLAAAFSLPRGGLRKAWLDVGAVSTLVVIAVTRLGCYLAGSDFGRAISARVPRWLLRLGSFPRPDGDEVTPVWYFHWARGSVNAGSLTTPALHPTALYEALAVLALCMAVLAARRFQQRLGQELALVTLGYALLRLLLEPLRDEAARGFAPGYWRDRVIVACALGVLGFLATQRESLGVAARD